MPTNEKLLVLSKLYACDLHCAVCDLKDEFISFGILKIDFIKLWKYICSTINIVNMIKSIIFFKVGIHKFNLDLKFRKFIFFNDGKGSGKCIFSIYLLLNQSHILR